MVKPMINEKERLFYLDNIKAILIILMVFGHLLILFLRDSGGELYQILWMFIYSFHMPVFFFVSGFVEQKRSGSGSRSTFNLFVYYLMMCAMVFFIRNGAGIDTQFSFFYPPFAAWFLLVLFICKLFVPLVKDMKHAVLLSIAISLTSGLFDDLGMFLSLQRAAAFAVFFMMGYFVPANAVDKIISLRPLLKSILALICFGSLALIAIYMAGQNITLEIYFNKLPYNVYFDNQFVGLAARALFICTSMIGIVGLLLIVPQKKNVFSYLGENSVSIYFFHTLLFYALMMDSLSFVIENGIILLFVTIAYALIAGTKPFAFILNKIVSMISYPFFARKGIKHE